MHSKVASLSQCGGSSREVAVGEAYFPYLTEQVGPTQVLVDAKKGMSLVTEPAIG